MSAFEPTVLLVDDDPLVRGFLADNLIADGYAVIGAETLGEGLRQLERSKPDVAVIDVGLPDGSGLELIARVRAAGEAGSRLDPSLPLLVLSGRGDELDRVRGFDRGADDYVVKPFSYPELRRRIEALLRRSGERVTSGLVRVGELEIDPVSRDVRVAGRSTTLSQKEFALLLALAAQPTRVFTKEELLRDVWGYRSMGRTRTLDSHACRLRQKLGGTGGRYVINVWGVGYRLVDGRPGAGAAAGDSRGVAA
jgi:DNA-binding response OmpR family regulator